MNKVYDPDLANCAKPADAASSIPPVYYTSENVALDEAEAVFRRGWIGVGRSDMVRHLKAAGFEVDLVTYFGKSRMNPFIIARKPR